MNEMAFCKMLSERISPEEWRLLERADSGLLINEHNRGALLEMRALASRAASPDAVPQAEDLGSAARGTKIDSTQIADLPHAEIDSTQIADLPHAEIDYAEATALEAELQAYLDEYMADAPEGHKWIVLASLYLTFVAKRPMHPIERAGVSVERIGDRTVYRCPSKAPGDNPICDNCVCEPLSL